MNPFREALTARAPVLGCWCTSSGALGAEAIALAGFTCVVVDMQHGSPDWGTLTSFLQAVELGGAASVVRVGWNNPESIMRALDSGASGVVIPMIDTGAQARAAAQATRYPPYGNRSFGPTRRRHPDLITADADVICMPMIETAEGLRNAGEIAAAEGVDGIFVGPADLGLSMGCGFDPTLRHPSVLTAIDRIVAAARREGRFVGSVAADGDHAADLFQRGVDFVTLGSDKSFIATGAAAAMADLHQAARVYRGDPADSAN